MQITRTLSDYNYVYRYILVFILEGQINDNYDKGLRSDKKLKENVKFSVYFCYFACLSKAFYNNFVVIATVMLFFQDDR